MGGVIPLSDVSRRPANFPVVTLAIIVLNFIVFIIELFAGQPFVERWSFVPADIAQGKHLETIFTAMFMHGSWSHILGNMVFLWAFGPEIEDAMGWWRYLIYYLLGGIAAALAQVAFDPSSTVPNLGASGAIAAVMGGFLVTYPRDQIRSLLVIFVFVRVTYIYAALLIGVWFLLQLVNIGPIVAGPVTGSQAAGGVAYMAHVGGFIFGAVFARLFEDPQRIAAQPVDDDALG
ncbi:MAG: rhomboid family intramembrane serine protease [Candidatus Eremiobacteraeota bacterium]|nr:rhomboid family intramembrane serine protease [Candidatus Eremiobacteraeota bacterium]MBV8366520.1 rhomboid family intramembrane serine protease [Candidatus Eremiobacteraeota bacterium]